MSDLWDRLGAKKEAPSPAPLKGEVTDGSFQCNTCYEFLDEAYYDSATNTLAWKCSNGHTSSIEVNW